MSEIIFWRISTVMAETGLKRSHLYDLSSKGEFPRPVKISKRASAWLASEVNNWKQNKLLARTTCSGKEVS